LPSSGADNSLICRPEVASGDPRQGNVVSVMRSKTMRLSQPQSQSMKVSPTGQFDGLSEEIIEGGQSNGK
jgi:hypothetical protein